MTDQKPIALTPEILSHALHHARALILVDEQVFDDTNHLKKVLREYAIVFDESDEHEKALTNLQQQLKVLKRMVYRDELTGILNRRGIEEEFGGLFREALSYKEHKTQRHGVVITDFSIIFLDIDNFKSINDRFGHAEGDRILQACARVLKESARETDMVGRLGGEEFLIGLLGATESEAYEKAEEVRKKIVETIKTTDGSAVTASMGVASLAASSANTLDALIKAADTAMYEAKHEKGKNTVVQYSTITS